MTAVSEDATAGSEAAVRESSQCTNKDSSCLKATTAEGSRDQEDNSLPAAAAEDGSRSSVIVEEVEEEQLREIRDTLRVAAREAAELLREVQN